jgi:hypothetical protein
MMNEIGQITTRLNATEDLPTTLAAAFDAFEVIRVTAYDGEDRAPGLFAAFVMTAGAAVEGRDAVTSAPSLPHRRSKAPRPAGAPPGVNADEIADDLAWVGKLLTNRMHNYAFAAVDDRDRMACLQAGRAAAEIEHLLARKGNDADIR